MSRTRSPTKPPKQVSSQPGPLKQAITRELNTKRDLQKEQVRFRAFLSKVEETNRAARISALKNNLQGQ